MRLGVVLLDVLELRRRAERLVVPVQVPHPPGDKVSVAKNTRRMDDKYVLVKVRISRPDVPKVALEVLHIYGIESDDGLGAHSCQPREVRVRRSSRAHRI